MTWTSELVLCYRCAMADGRLTRYHDRRQCSGQGRADEHFGKPHDSYSWTMLMAMLNGSCCINHAGHTKGHEPGSFEGACT